MVEKDPWRFERLTEAYGNSLASYLAQWEAQRLAALEGRLLPPVLLEEAALTYDGALKRLSTALSEWQLLYESYSLGKQPLMAEALGEEL